MRSSEHTLLFAASIALAVGVASSASRADAPPLPSASAAAPPAASGSAAKPAGSEEAPRPKRPERDANTCFTCHLSLPDAKLRKAAEEFSHSVHKDERIGCVACHKGNASDPTVQAHDKTTGFIVRPTHAQVAALCGGCHEDPTFVRRFNARLGVDQRKLFELSRHGKMAAAGDAASPTCTNCHGVHGILAVSSPNAEVNRRRVRDLCAKCHGNVETMKPYGLAATQPVAWSKSVHGKAFHEGSEQAPTCTGCHSPHAGTLPGTASVAALCDRCHQDERELFLKSPHSRAFRKLGLADCVPCHGDHDVTRTSWLAGMTPDSACAKCHSKDDKPKKVAEDIAVLLEDVQKAEHAAAVDLAEAKTAGLLVPDASFAVDRLRTAKIRLITTVHTLDMQQLGDDANAAKMIAQEARDLLTKARRDRQVERRGYFVAIGLASLLLTLLVAKSIQLARRRRRGES
ncbi:MAG: cytochrome c3 family protein [Deltaproteobacteria bacterium]|nr:cytochrome c3 family protein [Deltaproteobacteria bacterium]